MFSGVKELSEGVRLTLEIKVAQAFVRENVETELSTAGLYTFV
jgi:hypothetical protein